MKKVIGILASASILAGSWGCSQTGSLERKDLVSELERTKEFHRNNDRRKSIDDEGNAQSPVPGSTNAKRLTSYDAVPPLGEYLHDVPRDLWQGTGNIFSRDNIPTLLISASLLAGSFALDDCARDADFSMGSLTYIANDFLGGGHFHVAASAGMIAYGKLADNRWVMDSGVGHLEALAVTGVFTAATKYLIGRERPGGGSNTSFISGHTSTMAASAAFFSERCGWDPRVAIPLWGLTGVVAAARIEVDEHYFSDTVGGMVVGYLVGTSFAKLWKNKPHNVNLEPLITREGVTGLRLRIAF